LNVRPEVDADEVTDVRSALGPLLQVLAAHRTRVVKPLLCELHEAGETELVVAGRADWLDENLEADWAVACAQ
jgi:hypothetical protein